MVASEIYDVVNANDCTASSFSRIALRSAPGPTSAEYVCTSHPDGTRVRGRRSMEIIASERRPRRSSRLRRLASVLAIAAVAAGTVVATQPAAAADPWITQPEAGYVRFTIPNAARRRGRRAGVAGGRRGQLRAIGQLGSDRAVSAAAPTGRRPIGPLDPGLYYYQITGDDSEGPQGRHATPRRRHPSRSGARSSSRAIPRRCWPTRPRRPARSRP